MDSGQTSESSDNYTLFEWLMYFCTLFDISPEEIALSFDTLDSAPFSTLDLTHGSEPLPTEAQLGVLSTNAEDLETIRAAHSLSNASSPPPPPPLPSPQPLTFDPPKWYEIPQRPYNYGLKQWDFTPSEPIIFQVPGSPGMSMGDAYHNKFPGLEGRDDLVLQDARMAICCRFLFPGYPRNKSPQIFTTYWNKERSPITRSKLAHNVATKLKKYLDSMRNSHIMDASTDGRWEIGQGFMLLENIYLARLESVSRGSFQPQLFVIDRSV